jgi:hypothetical protein
VRYCGAAVGPGHAVLCVIGEVRDPEPPIRLSAAFYEPGAAADVAREIEDAEAVVAIAAAAAPGRACDEELRRRGVTPAPYAEDGRLLFEALAPRGVYAPAAEGTLEGAVAGSRQGAVEEGAYRSMPVFETNADGTFCALAGARVPARRHPLGIRARIDTLVEQHVVDDGGDLWHRRIEEIEAAAAALCAHRYAVGHACWVGDPAEGVVVLPGSRLPERFEGALAAVERLPLGAG